MYNWSDAQLRAIEAPDSVIVSASAGSGKTTLMIERMLRMMRSGIGVTQLLAVTFASAQADDMRAKLAKGLQEVLSGELTAAERKHLKECFYRLTGADICTLHRFCITVVRKYFYLTDAGADFRVSGETDTALRRARAMEDVITNAMTEGGEDFMTLYDALSRRRDHAPLARAVREICDLGDTLADPEELQSLTDGNAAAADAFLEKIRGYLAVAFGEWLQEIAENFDSYGMKKLAEYARVCAIESTGVGRGVSYETVRPTKDERANPFFDELYERLKEARSACKSADKKIAAALNAPLSAQPYTAVLFDLAAAYRARYARLKAADGVLDFNDLERQCLRVLTDPAAAQEIRDRYYAVFVDEYQDINPIQQAILSAVDSGRTFYVGDVKQSIYGFRLCDPSIFAARYSAMSAEGRTVDLNCNYRSARGILAFCDRVFSSVMTGKFGGTDYAERAKFVPVCDDCDKISVEIKLLNAPKTDTEKFVTDKVYRVSQDESERGADDCYKEGLIIADSIASLLRDGLGGGQVKYSDIAVLLRALSSAQPLIDALRESGIPVCVRSDCDLFASVHVLALRDLLRVIINPMIDYPLLTVMKRFFSFLDDELAAIRLECRDGEFHRAVRNYGGADAVVCGKLDEMRRVLSKLRAHAAVMTPYEVLLEGIRETDYYGKVLSEESGLTEYGLVKRFIEETRTSVYNTDIVSYLEYLDASPVLNVEVEEGAHDAVTVSTIHKAKGLEYDIVFVAGAGKAFNNADEKKSVFVSKQFGAVMMDYDGEERETAVNRLTEAAKLAIRFENRQEETRLWYVALTRAKKKLYIIGKTDAGRRRDRNRAATVWQTASPLEWILSAIADDARAEESREYRVEVVTLESQMAEAYEPAAVNADNGLIEAILQRQSFRYPTAAHAAKTTATEINESMRLKFTSAHVERLSDEDGTETGTAYHAVMQRLRFDGGNAAEQMDGMVTDKVLTARARSLVDLARIDAAAHALVAAGITDGEREVPFLARFDSEELFGTGGDRIAVQGIADLVARTPDGAVLVDYKTTAADEDYLSKAYTRQLWVYRDALRRAGYPIARVYIYSFTLCKLIEITDEALRQF